MAEVRTIKGCVHLWFPAPFWRYFHPTILGRSLLGTITIDGSLTRTKMHFKSSKRKGKLTYSTTRLYQLSPALQKTSCLWASLEHVNNSKSWTLRFLFQAVRLKDIYDSNLTPHLAAYDSMNDKLNQENTCTGSAIEMHELDAMKPPNWQVIILLAKAGIKGKCPCMVAGRLIAEN